MAGSGSDGLAELTAEELADLPDFTPNIYKVVRALRKDDHGPYNCLASIVHDAAFVKGVVREYRLPTFANLRCGLWYAGRHHAGNESWAGPRLPGEEDEPPESEDGGLGEDAERTRGEEEDDVRAAIDGTCYFKSTDGHCNNWSFSGTRLNVHVAETAARRGGCVIVDATRSTTKRFPDSFSKTVPIWAETLNRAVRDARRRARADASDAFQNETNAAENSAWDASSSAAGAAFPPWVGEQERERIRELFPLFSERLEAVSPDLSKLVKTLKAPLRCVWVSRETAARGLPLLTELSNENEKKPALAFTPVVLVSASSPMQWHGERRVGRDGRSFAYVPGAGDDEESWARGLTPDAFWRNRNFILNEGPSGCVHRVDDVVGRDAVSLAKEKEKRVEDDALIAESLRSPLQSPSSSSSSSVPAWEIAGSSDARRAAGGCLSGAGRAAAAAALGATLGAVRDGAVRVLYERRFEDDRSGLPSLIGVALGSVKALEKEETWSNARAVLFVGDAQLPPIVTDGVSRKTPPFDVPFLRLEARLHKIARSDLHDALPAALAFIEKHAPLVPFVTASSKPPTDRSALKEDAFDDEKKKYVLVACNDGADHCAGVAVARAVAADLFLNKKEDESGETRTEPAPLVTKDCVRRRLAAVSARHPEASPTRGTLKQVFNYLLDASKGRRADGG